MLEIVADLTHPSSVKIGSYVPIHKSILALLTWEGAKPLYRLVDNTIITIDPALVLYFLLMFYTVYKWDQSLSEKHTENHRRSSLIR